MTNLILTVLLFLIVGAAIRYIIKAKKNGVKCIGCPNANQCNAIGTSPCSGCSCNKEQNSCKIR